MRIIEKLNVNPFIFAIFLLAALLTIIMAYFHFWPNSSDEPEKKPNTSNEAEKKPIIDTNKRWGITREYSIGEEDFIEGWLTTDTHTWGATIPLPPFETPPEIDYWKEDGSKVDKPETTNRSSNQFTAEISSTTQPGKWIWQARGKRLK